MSRNTSDYKSFDVIFRCTCVDFVSGTLASTRSVDECAVVLSRYREAFTAIVNEILKKLQFRFNSSALEEMDDDKIGKFHECTSKFLNMFKVLNICIKIVICVFS